MLDTNENKLRLYAMHLRAIPLKGTNKTELVASIRNALTCNPYQGNKK